MRATGVGDRAADSRLAGTGAMLEADVVTYFSCAPAGTETKDAPASTRTNQGAFHVGRHRTFSFTRWSINA